MGALAHNLLHYAATINNPNSGDADDNQHLVLPGQALQIFRGILFRVSVPPVSDELALGSWLCSLRKLAIAALRCRRVASGKQCTCCQVPQVIIALHEYS